ncbi:hypothetical protein CEQ90_02320 [Lewinellaceae bacterium SD302]|nr:hypothetical protein CEQ90_02320 [Lewinellaceae bacterium SD302]
MPKDSEITIALRQLQAIVISGTERKAYGFPGSRTSGPRYSLKWPNQHSDRRYSTLGSETFAAHLHAFTSCNALSVYLAIACTKTPAMKAKQFASLLTIVLLLFTFSTCLAQENSTSEIVSPSSIERSLTTQLNRIKNAPLNERVALYQSYKLAHPGVNLEEEINLYGYNQMWSGNTEEALVFFELVVKDYPDSFNAYDSYAEALMNLGRNEEAIANYERSLELNPANYNAEDKLEEIRFPNKKRLSIEQKFDLTYQAEQYESDLDQLVDDILENHPNPFKFTTKEEWANVLAAKKAIITDKTTFAEFSWHCNEIVALMNCSHSGMSGFWNENRMLPQTLRFPLQTRWIDDGLYVIDPLDNADQVKVKDRIVAINGKAVTEILEDISSHIVSQGHIETSKRHKFNMFSTSMIANSLGFPVDYEVTIRGSKRPIPLNPSSVNPDPARDPNRADCGGDLCLSYLDTEKKIALLTIQSFNYYESGNYDEFVKFIDVNMNEMLQHGTQHLIIDVRGNGGGSPESSIYLLRYLMRKPFVYSSKADFPGKTEASESEKLQQLHAESFEGKLYFLIDGQGNSTTGHFMSLVKTNQLGTIIGEELGSNQFCNAGMTNLRLKNTKIEFHVANNTHVSTATTLPDEVGILPDHQVTQSVDAYLEGKDVVKDYAIDLIREQTEWRPASPYHASYFLQADNQLSKELFQIPLSFAPDMSLRGLEDARFLTGWNDTDSEYFWSYAFAWNLIQKEAVTTADLVVNLQKYFDGLMRMDRNSEVHGVPLTSVVLEKTKSSGGKQFYEGSVVTFDNFFQKKPLTFKMTAELLQCQDIGRSIILFRFSKRGYGTKAWAELNKIMLPVDLCRE